MRAGLAVDDLVKQSHNSEKPDDGGTG